MDQEFVVDEAGLVTEFIHRMHSALKSGSYEYVVVTGQMLLAANSNLVEVRALVWSAAQKQQEKRGWFSEFCLFLPFIFHWIVFFLIWRRQPARALVLLTRLQVIKPNSLQVMRWIGKLSLFLKANESAFWAFEQAIRMDKNRVEELLELAELHFKDGNNFKAQALSMEVLSRHSGNLMAKRMLQQVAYSAYLKQHKGPHSN